MLKRLLSIIVYLLFANSAWASGITDIKFGRYQIADSQWNVNACLNTNTCQIYSKNPGVAYKIPWTSGQLSWATGDYVQFALSGNSSFPYTATQYNANGTVKAVMGGGKIVNMGADYFFFVGTDNDTGQLFSGSSGMNSTAGVTWTGTQNPTIAQADTYADQNYSTTPLAPGQTAGPPPPPPPPSLCCGGSAAPFNANAAFTSRAQNFAVGNSDNSVHIEQIGNSNNIRVTQQGNKNYMSIYNNGSNSTIQTNQTSTNSTVSNYTELSLLGNNNNVNITQQSTAGAKGITSTINGNTNTVNVQQKDNGNHYLELNLAGGNKTVDILQQGSAAHMANITLNGGTTAISTTQSGTTAQSYSITHTCANMSCAAITVTQGQ
jgi:hypothetical protein